MTGLHRRYAWIAAAPFLAAATLAATLYTAAVWCADTVIDYGDHDDQDQP